MSHLPALLAARAFAPSVPFGEALASVHVPFDDLVGGDAWEGRVERIADSGGHVLLIGRTVEGKSGLVSYALSITTGRLAIRVPVSVPQPDGATAAQMPTLVLDGLANTLSSLDESATRRAQSAAARALPRPRVGGTIDIKGVKLAVDDLVREHRTMTNREREDAIHQAFAECGGGGLVPTLVLDDTDKWSSSDRRLEAGRAFFDEALTVLVDLGLPVVANAHPRYFDEDHPLPDRFDAIVRLPRIGAGAIRQILERRISAATDDDRSLDDIIEPDFVPRLAELYENVDLPIRTVIQLASEALIEAMEAGLERITIGALEAAVAARSR